MKINEILDKVKKEFKIIKSVNRCEKIREVLNALNRRVFQEA